MLMGGFWNRRQNSERYAECLRWGWLEFAADGGVVEGSEKGVGELFGEGLERTGDGNPRVQVFNRQAVWFPSTT
jgi:hypothetical protein